MRRRSCRSTVGHDTVLQARWVAHSGVDPARCQNSCTAYTAARWAAAFREFCESAAHFMSMCRQGASRDSISSALVAVAGS